jgi:hypothetical protein
VPYAHRSRCDRGALITTALQERSVSSRLVARIQALYSSFISGLESLVPRRESSSHCLARGTVAQINVTGRS